MPVLNQRPGCQGLRIGFAYAISKQRHFATPVVEVEHLPKSARPILTNPTRDPARRRPAKRGVSVKASSPGDTSALPSLKTNRASPNVLGRLYLSLLPGPLRYAPSLLFPFTVLASVAGAAYGHQSVHAVVSMLPATQIMEWVPMMRILQQVYSDHPYECNALVDTALSLIGALFTFVVLPAGDLLLGQDTHGPAEEAALGEGVQVMYRRLLYTVVLLHWTVLLSGCWVVSTGHVHPLAFLGLALSLGSEGGLCFTAAHELLHGRSRLDKFLAQALLCSVGYMHWSETHHMHHRKVATWDDPASARLGESLYMFVPRSVVGNLRDGWMAETKRLTTRQLPFLSSHNRLLIWAGAPLTAATCTLIVWGPWSFTLAIAQAMVAILLLEMVNYIEHYGLERSRLSNGRYERCAHRHSWNANWLFTNSVIFRLQRHSDHHAHADKPYQLLEDIPDAPQLPASYPFMMILALCPGIFRLVMDPRANAAALRSAVHAEQADAAHKA